VRHGLAGGERQVPALASAISEALSREWDREAIRARIESRTWAAVGREVVEEVRAAMKESERASLPSPEEVRA